MVECCGSEKDDEDDCCYHGRDIPVEIVGAHVRLGGSDLGIAIWSSDGRKAFYNS